MNEIGNVSHQAFLEQLENWELTLTREVKKLKQLKKISTSKLQINTIDITLLSIESELMQYRRIKEKKMTDNMAVIELYNALSKRFIIIIEKIGESADQERYKNSRVMPEQASRTEQTVNSNKSKHFLAETFTYNVSKVQSQPRKKTCSVIETKKQLNEMTKERSRHKPATKAGKSSDLKSKNRRSLMMTNLSKLQVEEEEDLSDIRYQLKQIKSMIKQMNKQIQTHSHDDVERQLTKISHNSQRLTMEMKAVRDDNQFILARMQNLSMNVAILEDEINNEKKIQNSMIKQFESGKHNSSVINELSKENNTTGEVSDWVKARI